MAIKSTSLQAVMIVKMTMIGGLMCGIAGHGMLAPFPCLFQLPDTLEELHAAVREHKSKADRMICPNPHVLEQYQQRTAEVRVQRTAVPAVRSLQGMDSSLL